VTQLSLFKGEITADAVTARVSAGTGPSGAGGNANGTAVVNLRVLGQPATGTVGVGDWGQLSVAVSSVDTSAPSGTKGYKTVITELDLKLTADHGGLPAGTEIQIGGATAAVQTAPPTTTTTPATTTGETGTGGGEGPSVGDAPSLRPRGGGKTKPQPLKVQPKLTAGRYVFPV
jgi:hypothetical protein